MNNLSYLDQFKGLNRQVYLICICRIIMGMGSMSYAFMSIHLRSILGLSEVGIGWVNVAVAIFSVTGGLVGGRLADIYGRKLVCVSAYGLQIATHIISIFLCRHRIMILLMVMANFFSMMGYPVFAAMVSDSSDPQRSKESFSLMYLCSNIGVAIGPSIGGLLFYNHLELTYVVQAVFVGAGILFFALTTKENYSRQDAFRAARTAVLEEGTQKDDSEKSLLRVVIEHKLLLVFVASLAVVSICYQMVNFMLSMQTTDLFGLEISSKYCGFVWTTNGIVIVLLTPLLLTFTKRNHHFVNMALGVVLYAIGYGSYSFMKHPIMVVVGAVIWTVGEILISTGAGAFIASNSPKSHVARCQSLYETARQVGKAAGPLLFGYLLSFISYNSAWRINSAICILVGIWVYFSWKKAGCPKE